MEKRRSYVYKITCKITGEYYFGSSFYIMRNSYWGGGTKIRERVAQYGKENFVKEILDQFDDRVEAHKVENEYIEQFINDDKCLNRKCEHHYKSFSSDTIQKMADGHMGSKNLNFGKHLSEKTRDKLSAVSRGKTMSEETKQKIRESLIGRTPWNKGKKLNEETKQKIRESIIRRTPWNKGKKLNKDTGKYE